MGTHAILLVLSRGGSNQEQLFYYAIRMHIWLSKGYNKLYLKLNSISNNTNAENEEIVYTPENPSFII